MKTRSDAYTLLTEYTKSQSLLTHAESVEAAMQWYARHFDCSASEQELWAIAGLLHDFDYELYPEPGDGTGHPYEGVKILREQGYPESICEAILGHAEYTGTSRSSLMAKALFAVDELSGLIVAASLVRPDKSLHNLELDSVKKRFKDKAFARGCNREDIQRGAEELGIPLETHFQNVLTALKSRAT